MASRFDYQGKVTTNVNGQKKKKRELNRPKETPVGPPKRLVQEQSRTRTYLPNPGQASTGVKPSVAGKAPRASSGVSNKPKANPRVSNKPKANPRVSNTPTSRPARTVSVGPSPTQAATRTSTGNGGLRAPRVSVSISNETAIGRVLNHIFTGSPQRTVEERRKRPQGIRERAGR